MAKKNELNPVRPTQRRGDPERFAEDFPRLDPDGVAEVLDTTQLEVPLGFEKPLNINQLWDKYLMRHKAAILVAEEEQDFDPETDFGDDDLESAFEETAAHFLDGDPIVSAKRRARIRAKHRELLEEQRKKEIEAAVAADRLKRKPSKASPSDEGDE